MNREKLMLILNAFRQAERDGLSRESDQSAGSTYLRERLTVVAERCCRDFPGDLVEIGTLNGSTTVRLCAVAWEHGRRVIAIDPYEIGTQNCTGVELYNFQRAIEPYKDIVDFLRLDSRDPKVAEYLKGRELAFAFIDGLHTFDAASNDIRITYHAGLIAVDDWHWNAGVRQAVIDATGIRHRIMESPYHESYLL